jgi:hypothetical protein
LPLGNHSRRCGAPDLQTSGAPTLVAATEQRRINDGSARCPVHDDMTIEYAYTLLIEIVAVAAAFAILWLCFRKR